jgi:hypothetical protein
MAPGQLMGILVTALITGLIGYLIGRRAGRGNAGFWLGFLLSVIGLAVITIVAIMPSDASEARKVEAMVRREEGRLRIQLEAQRRIDAEREGQR